MPRDQQQLGLAQVYISDYELGLLADVRHTLERLSLFLLDALGLEPSRDYERQVALLTRLAGNRGSRCEVPR